MQMDLALETPEVSVARATLRDVVCWQFGCMTVRRESAETASIEYAEGGWMGEYGAVYVYDARVVMPVRVALRHALGMQS